MKAHRILTVAFAVLGLGAPLAAQAQGAAQDRVAAIKESLQKSQAAIRQYQWVQTTVISIKGEEKSQKQESCYYGADGTLQKTPIGSGEPEQSKGRRERGLRGRIVEHKTEAISDSAKQAVALVKEYLPPDPSKIQAAKDAGNLSVVPPDDQGVVEVVIKNYLKQGDSLTIAANASTNKLTGVKVATYTDDTKDAVGLDVVFGTLDDGTVYQEKVDLDVKAENLSVAITNSGYKKVGG